MARNHYQILKVANDASEADIRKAFRVKAKEIHPDHNPDDPSANAKFIALKAAHDLLVDPIARHKYDRELLRSDNNSVRSNKRKTDTARKKSTEGRAAPNPRRGHDVERTVRVTLEEVWNGSQHTVIFDDRRHTIYIRGIPADNRICYPGRGRSGEYGGPEGDLYVVVEIVPHSRFIRDGDDLKCRLSLNSEIAQRGGEINVPTLSGTVRMTVEAGTRTGRSFRIKGRGLPRHGTDNEFGDLYVHITVKKPVPIRGNNLERPLRISLQEAWSGGEHQLSHRGTRLNVTIRPGERSEQRIPFVGEGEPGRNGGPPGDLYIIIEVLPDEQFRRYGDDLYLKDDLEINLNTALNGGKVEVPVFSGNVILNVPPETQFGENLSFPGRGMPKTDPSGKFGDLHTRVSIQVPDSDDWEADNRYNSWYWPARRQQGDGSLYLKIQFKEGCYDWAVLVNNSRLEYRGRDPRYCGKCCPTNDSKQAKLDAAARARTEATIALLRRTRDERISVDVGEIPF